MSIPDFGLVSVLQADPGDRIPALLPAIIAVRAKVIDAIRF